MILFNSYLHAYFSPPAHMFFIRMIRIRHFDAIRIHIRVEKKTISEIQVRLNVFFVNMGVKSSRDYAESKLNNYNIIFKKMMIFSEYFSILYS